MKVTGSQLATFTHSSSEHKAKLSWGIGFLWSFPYKLQIDGAPVSETRVYVQNWPLGLFPAILLVAILMAILHFIRHVSRG